MKEKILKLLSVFLGVKQFTFRFDEYNGTESALQIYDGQVMEYEFINAGSSVCIINGGLKLYPEFSGMSPTRVKLSCNYNERDVTVYNYKFEKLDLSVVTDIGAVTLNGKPIYVPFVNDTVNITYGVNPKNPVKFNRLVVISKVQAKVKPRKFV